MQKKLVIAVLILVAAIFFWTSAERWTQNPTWSLANVDAWLVPLLTLVLLASLLGLAFMLISEFWVKLVISVISVAPFVALYGIAPIYFGAAAVMVVMHASAISRISEEVTARIKINAKHIVRRGMGMIILPHLLLISFAYYQSPGVQAAGKNNQLPSSIQKAIEGAAETFLGSELDKIPPEQRQKVQGQVINEVMKKITDLVKPYFQYLPPVLAFGLFLALQSVSFILFELSAFLALGLFFLLRTINFVKIEEKTVLAEVLII